MRRSVLYSLVLAMLFAVIGQAEAEPVLNPANGHYYEVVVEDWINWHDARVAAGTSTFMGIRGHLATITSQDENDFIAGIVPSDVSFWVGGFQPSGSPEPAGNWQWVTGEPFDYTNWAPDEPNNWFGDDPNEDRVEFYDSGEWNDLPADFELIGYIVEYPVSIDGLIALVRGMNLHKGIENSLISKLRGAKAALERGQQHVAINKLNAFINQVKAQRGKKVTEDQADELIAYANGIISALGANAAPAKQRRLSSEGKLASIWGRIKAK